MVHARDQYGRGINHAHVLPHVCKKTGAPEKPVCYLPLWFVYDEAGCWTAQVDLKRPLEAIADDIEQPYGQLIYQIPSAMRASFGNDFAPLFLRQLHVLERHPGCFDGALQSILHFPL